MVCFNCEPLQRRRRKAVIDQLCPTCGHLLGTDDVVRRVLEKQCQLALFGLDGTGRPLLRRAS